MELRRITICVAFFVLASILHCSEARTHTLVRRDASPDVNYDDAVLSDAAEDDTQNDADQGEDEEETVDAEIMNMGENFRVGIGKTVRLPCSIEPSPKVNKAVAFQWLKDNQTIFLGTMKLAAPDRMAIEQETGTYLMIHDLQGSDSGTYKCEVMRDSTLLAEKPNYIEHTVRVEEAPRISGITVTDSGRVVEGTDVIIACAASGSPPPKLIWSKQEADGANHRLNESEAEFAANSIILRSIKRSQAGTYLCYADNMVGNPAVREIKIKVLGKPRIHVPRKVVNSDLNVVAELQCSAHEEPPAHIRWYKDGALIEDAATQYSVSTNGQHSTLSVTPTSDADFGTFTCEAENQYGKHSVAIDLVQTPVIEDLEEDGTKLTWKVHSRQPLEGMEIQAKPFNGDGEPKSITVPVPSRESHTVPYEVVYLLDDQLEAGKYEVLVNAKNKYDWSGHTQRAVVDIEPQAQLISASVFGSNAHSIRPTSFLLSTIVTYLLVRML